ncbi:MAG: VWA domain-containing protein [Candidatus Aminicenantes bacterium]|nr:VWA domain-containing protein [Candidatus Aminicenantes bacterium]
MKKHFIPALVLTSILAVLTAASSSAVSGPRPAPGSATLAIPLAVRVYDGNTFVPDLTLKDFTVLEAGFAVEPTALLCVNKETIVRQEGIMDVLPNPARQITLLFRMSDYNNKVAEGLDAFFKTGLLPGDTLEIQTPMKSYKLSPDRLASKPRDVLAKELSTLIRKDIVQGGMAYNSLMRDLKRIVRQIGSTQGGWPGRTGLDDTEADTDDGSSLEMRLMNYTDSLQKMESLRVLSEDGLVSFASRLKSQPGQKFVYYFFQREFRPEIGSNAIDQLVMANQDRPDILAGIQTVFQMYSRSITLDHQRLKEAFADSGAHFNFLFMNKQPEKISGVVMREQSEDIFKALSTIAQATGGIADTSQNPAASFKTTLKESENYYILYFRPASAAPPGTFMDLSVKVKSRDYRVVHRAGYLTGS